MFERFKRRRKLWQMRKRHELEIRAIKKERLPEELKQNLIEAQQAKYIQERQGL